MKKKPEIKEGRPEKEFADLFENLYKKEDLKVGFSILDCTRKFGTTLEKLLKIPSLNNPLIMSAMFLFAFEGIYVSLIDTVVLLLISNGHDLFYPLRNSFVHSVEEIGKVDVEIKFRFLKEHGFELLIREEDQILRNKIAHNNFELDENNKAIIKIKDKPIFIRERFDSLLTFSTILVKQIPFSVLHRQA